MEERSIIWFDEEGDFLEIRFGKKKGFFRDIDDDIWERVDEDGKIRGIAILNFRKRTKEGEIELPYELNFQKLLVANQKRYNQRDSLLFMAEIRL